MKVDFYYREDDGSGWGPEGAIRILADGKTVFSVSDGEPEDANLSRDFSDCWEVPNLMKKAYEAGKRGEEFELNEINMEDD